MSSFLLCVNSCFQEKSETQVLADSRSLVSYTSKSPGESCTFVHSCLLLDPGKQSRCVQEVVASLFSVCGLRSNPLWSILRFPPGCLFYEGTIFNSANLLPSSPPPPKTFLKHILTIRLLINIGQ